MSAVVTGALIPKNSHWELLNFEIMVIETKEKLGQDISDKLNDV